MVWEPTHPNKAFKGWQMEHRVVVEREIGRYLDSTEHVHHVNGDKGDNRADNLAVMSNSEHSMITAKEYREWLQRLQNEVAEYRRRFGPLEQE